MTKLKRLLKFLRLFPYNDGHDWVLINKYSSNNCLYTYKQYMCMNTGYIKRVTQFGNEKPIIQISTQ